ncbi:MAG: hypothetical protein ACREBG_04250 [Pyrinomonadaceae bacterium]
MTPEQRLDRLERIAKLFVKAGLRARRNMRELNEKFDLLVNMQIKTEEKFARNEERFARNEERFAHTDRKLAELIDVIREGRNGTSLTSNN